MKSITVFMLILISGCIS